MTVQRHLQRLLSIAFAAAMFVSLFVNQAFASDSGSCTPRPPKATVTFSTTPPGASAELDPGQMCPQ